MEVDGADAAESVDNTSSSNTKTKASGHKDHKSSKQLCEEMGIVDVECDYAAEDYTNLVTYKLFQQHIRPFLLEKNPKLVMYKMVSVIGAKWREFLELKEKWQREAETSSDNKNEDEPAEEQTIKSLLDESKKDSQLHTSVDEAATSSAKPKRGGPGRGKAKQTAQQAQEEAETAAAVAAAAAAADDQDSRRTSSRTKRGAAAAASANISATVASEAAPVVAATSSTSTSDKVATPKGGRNSRASMAAAAAAIVHDDQDDADNDEVEEKAAAAADKAKRTSTGRAAAASKKKKKRDVSWLTDFYDLFLGKISSSTWGSWVIIHKKSEFLNVRSIFCCWIVELNDRPFFEFKTGIQVFPTE